MGEGKPGPLRVDLDRRVKLEFHGSEISSESKEGAMPIEMKFLYQQAFEAHRHASDFRAKIMGAAHQHDAIPETQRP